MRMGLVCLDRADSTVRPRGGRGDRDRELDFEALLTRIHPAASRIAELAWSMPALIVLWDLLVLGDRGCAPHRSTSGTGPWNGCRPLSAPEGLRS